MNDITANYHGGNSASVAAHQSIAPVKLSYRQLVVDFISDQGSNGATSDEVEVALGLSHQSISARISEAKAVGSIVDSGLRRVTRNGRMATVLVAP